MASAHNPKLRFGIPLSEARSTQFRASLRNGPPLPAIDFGLVGKPAPTVVRLGSRGLPKVSTVVITWADAEWAALEHVFCSGSSPMPYSDRTRGAWAGWQKYAVNLPAGRNSTWTYWGFYQTVEIDGKPVLLFKSNTHLDWPGAASLIAMIKLLIAEASPSLVLSIGTAGGAKPQDHIGVVRAVSAGTLFESGKPEASWPEYKNGWTANSATIGNPNFKRLLFPVPLTTADLQSLCSDFNSHLGAHYTLSELDPDGLCLGASSSEVDDQTGGGASLLTTSTFVVGTTAGNYQNYTAIEMDDAVIGEACAGANVSFGFVRNISDPVQNANLPLKVQGAWGSAVYDALGFYTSYNGAIATWATLA